MPTCRTTRSLAPHRPPSCHGRQAIATGIALVTCARPMAGDGWVNPPIKPGGDGLPHMTGAACGTVQTGTRGGDCRHKVPTRIFEFEALVIRL
jgi:hypothetical protein